MYKRSAGELRAKLLSGEQDKQRTVTKVWPVCGTLRGKVGPGCGARGRRRGLAGLRDDAPSHRSETWPHWRGGRRRVRRARAGFEIDHSEPPGSRVAISRAAGPDGARNTRGAASNPAAHSRGSEAPRRLGPPAVCCRVACGPTGVPGAVGSGRPRDRHTRAWRLGVVDLEARPCPPDPPTPSTPVRPGL